MVRFALFYVVLRVAPERYSVTRAVTLSICRPVNRSNQRILLRKEVIQPLVPQRLPCYDFILVTDHTFGAFFLLTG